MNSPANISAHGYTRMRRKFVKFGSTVCLFCKIVVREHRVPGRCHQLYFSLLDKLGKRTTNIRLRNGMTVKGFTHCFHMFYEVWSKRDYDIPGFVLDRNSTVIDIGANQGFFSMYAASKGATVYAFEPCQENFEILQWNVAKNGLTDRVKAFKRAVTGTNGKVSLFIGLNASGDILSGSVSTRNANRGGADARHEEVDSVSLDSLLRDLRIGRCGFLKVDCEGAKYEILNNAFACSLRKIARISMECHESRIREAADVLKKVGFQIVYQAQGETGLLKAKNARVS